MRQTPCSSTRARRVRSPALLSAVGAAVMAAGLVGSAGQRTSVPQQPDDRTIAHTLNRLGFGAAPGDIERVRQLGLATYIERQLHPQRIADEKVAARLARFETLTKSSRELAREYFLPALALRREQRRTSAAGADALEPDMRGRERPSLEQMQAARAARSVLGELAEQKVIRAVYSERQLEEALVDFWFNHFNVFAGKGATRLYLTEYERDAIRPHALGRFRDLLGATARSPAMLFYLDNWQSAADGGALNRRPRGLNENYARELMELHTLGVDSGYTQNDVREVARAFTGWTIDVPRQGGSFRFQPRMHDASEKTVLGHRIEAGRGIEDGEQVLDILAAHPSTARFIATKLARKFVSDAPPPQLVERAAATFRETGGDIREVVRTIATSAEFFAPTAYRAKVKTPFEFVVSSLRAAGAEIPAALPVVESLRELGMPLYGCQPPTGYADRADAWVNTGALLERMNFAVALTEGKLRGIVAPADATFALAGDVSATTTATIARASTAAQRVALILGSPEFQKR